MPTVFLSYSREDLPLYSIEQLEVRLKASSPDISIWRDQEKIYGGQKWSKVLGEAIADQHVKVKMHGESFLESGGYAI